MIISDNIAFALCMRGVLYLLSFLAKLLIAPSRGYHLWMTPMFSLFRHWHVADIFIFLVVRQCISLLGSCSSFWLGGEWTWHMYLSINDFPFRFIFFQAVSSFGAADVFCELILEANRLHWKYLAHVSPGSGSFLRIYSSWGCLFWVGGGDCKLVLEATW